MTQRYSLSALKQFMSCPLSFYYKYVVGLRLRTEGTNQHHLVYGKAMHAALEVLYGGSSLWAAYFTLGVPERALALEFAKGVFLEQYPTQLDPADHAKTIANGQRTIELYAKRWATEDSRWRVIDCELLDCELLPKGDDESEEDSWYRRRLDLVVEDLKFGGIYGVDHKFVGGQRTKYLNDFYWNQFDPDSQITQYTDWIRSKYGRCDGFFINAIGMNWIDEKDKGGKWNGSYFDPADPAQPWLEWSENELRYVKYYKKEMWAAWGLNVRFRREMFNRNGAQIEQERASTKYWIKQIEKAQDTCECGHSRSFHPGGVDHNPHLDFDCDACRLCNKQDGICTGFQTVYGFDTSSCTFCEYRGNDAEPGPCKAGWTWPQDQALIELSYRRECRQIIMLICPSCGGGQVDLSTLRLLGIRPALEAFNDVSIQSESKLRLYYEADKCKSCQGIGHVEGSRCVLDLDHEGECSSEMPVMTAEDFSVEVPI